MSDPQDVKLANEELQAQADKLQELAELLDVARDSWSKKEAIGMVTYSFLATEFPMALDVSEPDMLPCTAHRIATAPRGDGRHIANRAE